ncbi:Protein-serine/threonine phosphatase [Heracleum sosnowskyi]|uniref:protein-serine/threonine phosphatase n=1 Tax=Heracleum sosnowskyi TaxID=360622 RepID=A0AAD8HDG7_9APIA|nr:Protein-serine/threonine phosphatase [Heracleum sosnowskyi]
MSRLGFKSVVYDGDCCLGELQSIPVKNQSFQFPNNEIRIHHLSLRSERCPPISVLQTIAPFSVRCKLESKSSNEQPHLLSLHSTCFHELKTAVVLVGEKEIHLVAMLSKQKNYPCFWCYSVRPGLYDSCLGMLNLRCLSIVFDLDETLIVANTNKSFEDRIEVLRSWIERETDPVRISGMSAEMKRYVEDRAFLKQYTENDSVVDNGKVYNVQAEEVPKVLESQARVVRPVIRLPEKNIVLTRINPEVRDTSVLVRLRPAWDDLRSYLIAKGRKRFEVYVCTMAERDYALEMWRLLDPDANLIGSKQLLDRVVCVKSGARKSLLNVFKDGNCHPKMAMVIDDRMKVWDDKDQSRVHVVPAFTPYYAPHAETANAVPVLCVARNVACNVRGGFFKELDENLLRSISEMFYEDEVDNLPSAPDVSNYMMSEDASFVPYNGTNPPMAEGINGPEVRERLAPLDEKANVNSASYPVPSNFELRSDISQHFGSSTPTDLGPAILGPLEKTSWLGPPSMREVSLSESDHGVKNRIPTMNHKQDLRHRDLGDPPLLSTLLGKQSVPATQPMGGRLAEEDMKRRRFVDQPLGINPESNLSEPDRQRGQQISIGNGTSGSLAVGFSSHLPKSEEACLGHEVQRQNLRSTSQTPDFGNSISSNGSELQSEGVIKHNLPPPSIYIEVLQEIGERCNSKVEFRSVLSTSENLQFSVEVLFTGEKIGFGMGKTRKDAQQQAAGSALRNLADVYISHVAPSSGAVGGNSNKPSNGIERGFLWDTISPEAEQPVDGAPLTKEGTSEVRNGDAAAHVAKMASGSSDAVNQQHVPKCVSPPRLLESNPSKRLKDELLQKSNHASQKQPKNGQAVT